MFTRTTLALFIAFACPPDLHCTPVSAGNGIAQQSAITAGCAPCTEFNDLNTLIRDGKIGKGKATAELSRLLNEVRREYYLRGGTDYSEDRWIFPLAGYDSRAIANGRNHGFMASGYDYFSGNRHGGHPAFDIFIRDRNRDSRDDRTGQPVKVLSLTGGIVVAREPEWNNGSGLRGGRYLWIYDPASELLVYYAHNNELLVELGDMVKPGDELGTVGRSGLNASKQRSPTHLHLSVLKIRDGRPLPLDVFQQLKRAGKKPSP